MTDTAPLFEEKRFGFRFTVYPNRIETQEGTFGRVAKNETLLLKTVTAVEVVGMSRKLRLTTQDGRVREYNLGTHGEQARQTIVGLL
jgi:hypothetical protein